MNLSRIQKRKWPGCNDTPGTHAFSSHKDIRSSPPPPTIPLFSGNENNPFPSDQITSDPTFFDDYIPVESPQTSTSPAQSFLDTTPPTSPMGSSRSLQNATEDPQSSQNLEFAAISRAIISNKENPTYQSSKSMAHATTPQSMSQFKRRKLTSEEVQRNANNPQETHYTVENDLVRLSRTSSNDQPQLESGATVTAQTEPSLVAEEEATISVTCLPKNAYTTPSVVVENADVVAYSSSALSPKTDQAIHISDASVPRLGYRRSTGGAHTMGRTRRSLPTPAVIHVPKEARQSATPAKRERLQGTRSKLTHGLQFSITKPPPHEAYLVKHANESQSDAGKEWASLKKEGCFHVSFTRHARVRYNVGDIVNISFPKGLGGSAKIIEVRTSDTALIVVQWLYSRSDVVDSGAVVPRLEHWPRDLHIYSDHFQVVSAENIDGRSGATPVDDCYWAATSRRMRPLAELESRM